jgi:hypothetical protein
MALIYLHLVNALSLGLTALVYFRFPHLWDDQAQAFFALAGLLISSLSVLAVGGWALATRSSGLGKILLHAFLVLAVAAGAGYFVYHIGNDYHLIDYIRLKLR